MRVAIRLTPRAGADRIDGIVCDAAGGMVLQVAVTAPPLGNRANDALLKVLARAWRLPQRDLQLITGAKNRNKTVRIAGDASALLVRLEPLLAALPRR